MLIINFKIKVVKYFRSRFFLGVSCVRVVSKRLTSERKFPRKNEFSLCELVSPRIKGHYSSVGVDNVETITVQMNYH